jgi:hypothetical protein
LTNINSMKIVGKRRHKRNGLESAAPFLDLVIELHAGKPFMPKGVHRFKTFEESQQWSMKMMARKKNPDPLR